MGTTRHSLPLVGVTALAACTPGFFRADAGAIYSQVKGSVGLQNSGGTLVIGNNMADLQDDLGVGDEQASPYVRLEADWGNHRVKVSGFRHQSSGSGTLQHPFGDLVAGSAVNSDLEFDDITASWSYDLMPTGPLRLGLGVQVGYYGVDLSVRSIGGFETVTSDLIAPMPYVDGEVDVGIFSFGANAGALMADLHDATARYWDAEGYARMHIGPALEVLAGYRYLLIDAHGTADNRDFDADFEVTGWFLGGGIRF